MLKDDKSEQARRTWDEYVFNVRCLVVLTLEAAMEFNCLRIYFFWTTCSTTLEGGDPEAVTSDDHDRD
jgi:hypothetical protein